MTTLPETVWVRIDGEPFLLRALAYKAAELACRRAWAEFGRAMGASGVPACFAGERPSGLIFDGKPPAGWLAPKRSSKVSLPGARNDEVREAMKALPVKPRTYDVFGDALIDEVQSEGSHGREWHGSIGFLIEGPSIGWAGDVIFALIPHAGNAAANIKARTPDVAIINGADAWALPAGLTEVSKAEVDLLIAERRVAAERQRLATAEQVPA